MILSRKSFLYKEIVVIERITIKLPFRYEASFQNEGCFLFMKDANTKITSVASSSTINHKEAILLKCGTYIVDWVNNNSNEQVEVIAFHLPSSILKEFYASELPLSFVSKKENKHITPIAKDEIIIKFIESLEFYFDNPELINDDILALKIKELILLLLQSSKFHNIQDLLSNIYSQNTFNLKEVVQSHLFSDTSINDLAKLTNMSLSSFKREFQKQYATSPGDYFLAHKIKKAKSLLQSTSLTIAEVAYEVGHNDPSYFTRVFKLKAGCTPTQFRQLQIVN
ncbi:helix-turn-helix domain-containing protein [Fulvivirga lutimaris]|uniref:helix-turn-helix domain-containing protein n=1 Tax=Fulvivirga lutimaris TaxID=1819566 RepID=UPI0012BC4837|nr:AraC family transcriptional regulator [Fulvivirga lutimaris]MTI38934.1 AraC family transcriptional regulator [Fulvivirga lutimaris]